MIYKDYIRVLHINLETQKIRIDERKDLKEYIGGVGVASKLLEEHMRPELPPLAPEQPIVFAIGALSTIFPVVTKTVAMFVSPLTGELGESYAGGRMAMTLFEAGFDALVITGKSKHPIYINISYNNVVFKDARVLWKTGMDSAGRIIRETEYAKGLPGKRSIIRIGMAGEHLVSYACVTVDKYRHFGRLGLGCVFGSKHLIALNMTGGRSIPVENFPAYFKAYREIYNKATEPGGVMSKYHDLGTSVNVRVLNAIGALPTLNMQQGSFEHADEVSGEAFAENNLVRKLACVGCPVACIHIGQFRRSFSDLEHEYEYEAVAVAYDYELIYALGTFLGIKDRDYILELIEEAEIAGLDVISTGVCLGWATEAYQNGLISLEQTLEPLAFGEYRPYLKAIKHIASATNKFYRDLGKGLRHASKIYGGEDYAMQVAGNEMPGYPTGYTSLVGVAVAARHSHLCNGGYSIDQALDTGAEPDADKIADMLLKEEIERCMLNSLVICLFARKVYDRETILKAFAAIGEELTDDDLTRAAERIYATKLRIKKKLKFDLRDVKLPKRFFETPTMHGVLDEAKTYEIIEKYRERISGMAEDLT